MIDTINVTKGLYYKQLIVWQKADEFVKLVYLVTKDFPSEEKFGVTSQLRRASLSVPLNIVEGQARASDKDFVRFLVISRASLMESAYLLELSKYFGYLDEDMYNKSESLRREVGYLLSRTISSIRD